MRRSRVGAAAVALVAAVAGCGSSAEPAPAEFTRRDALPSCGEVEVRPDATAWEALLREPAECLSNARRDGGAEFTLTTYTDEGDPIVRYFRVTEGSGDVELWTDSSQDEFGGGGPRWRHATCTLADVSTETLMRCMRY